MSISGSGNTTIYNISFTEKAKTCGTRGQKRDWELSHRPARTHQQKFHERFRYAVMGFIDSDSCFGSVIAKMLSFIIDFGKPGTLTSNRALDFKSKQTNCAHMIIRTHAPKPVLILSKTLQLAFMV